MVSNNIFILLQVFTNTQMGTLTLDDGRMIKEKAKELTYSKMEEQKKEIGRITINMD